MSLETELRSRLVDDVTVSGLASTRIYALTAPQDPTLPYVTYQRISGPRLKHLTGASGRATARIQIDSWSDNYVECQSLAAAIRDSLHAFNGTLTSIKAVITLDNEQDIFEEDAGTSGLYRIIQDFLISYSE